MNQGNIGNFVVAGKGMSGAVTSGAGTSGAGASGIGASSTGASGKGRSIGKKLTSLLASVALAASMGLGLAGAVTPARATDDAQIKKSAADTAKAVNAYATIQRDDTIVGPALPSECATVDNVKVLDETDVNKAFAAVNAMREFVGAKPVEKLPASSYAWKDVQLAAQSMTKEGNIAHGLRKGSGEVNKFKCYTDNGAQATMNAVLAASGYNKWYPYPNHIRGLIEDRGTHNAAVLGHRSQMLSKMWVKTAVGAAGDNGFSTLDMITLGGNGHLNDDMQMVGGPKNYKELGITTSNPGGTAYDDIAWSWPGKALPFPYQLVPNGPNWSYNNPLVVFSTSDTHVTVYENKSGTSEKTYNGAPQYTFSAGAALFKCGSSGGPCGQAEGGLSWPQPNGTTAVNAKDYHLYLVKIDGGKVQKQEAYPNEAFLTDDGNKTFHTSYLIRKIDASSADKAPVAVKIKTEFVKDFPAEVNIYSGARTMPYEVKATNTGVGDAEYVFQLQTRPSESAEWQNVGEPAIYKGVHSGNVEIPANTAVGTEYRIVATDYNGEHYSTTMKVVKKDVLVNVSVNGDATQSVVQGTAPTKEFKASVDPEGYEIKWQKQEGSSWVDVSPEVHTLTYLPPAADAQNVGEVKYRAIFIREKGDAAEFTLKVIAKLQKGSINPTGPAVVAGNQAELTLSGQTAQATLQWQEQKPGSTTWTDIASANDANYKTPADAVNGTKYRVHLAWDNGVAQKDNTDPVTLSVIAKLVPGKVAPESVTVVAGDAAQFAVSGTNPSDATVQWQKKAPGDQDFSDIDGKTGANFTTDATTVAESGTQYRAKVTTNKGGIEQTDYTNVATLKVVEKLVVGKATVTPEKVVAGNEVTLNVTGVSPAAATYKWQKKAAGSNDWADVPNGTTAEVKFNAAEGDNGNSYQVIVSYTAEGKTQTVTKDAGALTVVPKLAIKTEPNDITVTEGKDGSLTTAANLTDATVKWQKQAPGGSWEDIADATSATLELKSVTKAMSGTKYRAVFTTADPAQGPVTTREVTLTVADKQIETLDAPEGVTTPSGTDPASKLPAKVTAHYDNGTTDEVAVTWSSSEAYKNRAGGSYELTGTVAGTSKTVKIVVTVTPATITAVIIKDGDGYAVDGNDKTKATETVDSGTAPKLPAEAEVQWSNGDKVTEAITWPKDEQYKNPAGGKYTLTGTVANTGAASPRTVTIEITRNAATVKSIAKLDDVNTKEEVAPVLPKTVEVTWSNGDTTKQNITWPEIDKSKYAQVGEFEVTGNVEGTGTPLKTVTIKVHVLKKVVSEVTNPADITVENGTDPKPQLPTEVDVKWDNGTSGKAKVTWDSYTENQWKNTSATETSFTIEGTVEGSNIKAKQVVHVKAAEVASVEIVADTETPARWTIDGTDKAKATETIQSGKKPVLPTKANITYKNGLTKSDVAITWNEDKDKNYNKREAGTYELTGTVAGTGAVAPKTVKLEVTREAATVTSVAAPAAVEVLRGTKAADVEKSLPKTVKVTWSNGDVTDEPVTWTVGADSDYAAVGDKEVSGTVAGQPVKITVKVVKVMAKVLDKNGNEVQLEAYQGEPVTIKGYGFADGKVTFTLHSTPIELGKAVSKDGVVTLTVPVPTNAEPGDHMVILTQGSDKAEVALKVLKKETPKPTTKPTTKPSANPGDGTVIPDTGQNATPLLIGTGIGILVIILGLILLLLKRRKDKEDEAAGASAGVSGATGAGAAGAGSGAAEPGSDEGDMNIDNLLDK